MVGDERCKHFQGIFFFHSTGIASMLSLAPNTAPMKLARLQQSPPAKMLSLAAVTRSGVPGGRDEVLRPADGVATISPDWTLP